MVVAVGISAALRLPADVSPAAVAQTAVGERGKQRGPISEAQHKIAQRLAASRPPARPLRDISIRLTNVQWNDPPRRPFLHSPSIRGVLDIAATARGDVLLKDVVVTRANVWLEQPVPDGEWNYERVLAGLLDADGDGDGDDGTRRTVRVTNVRVIDSRAEVHQQTLDIAFENVNSRASRVQFSSPQSNAPELDITTLATTYVDLRKQERLVVSLADARLRLPKSRVDFTVARATLGTATELAALTGTWQPGAPGFGITIAGRGVDVLFEDLAFFSKRLPRTGRGSFIFDIRSLANGGMDVRLANADIRADGSRLTGAVALRTGEGRVDVNSIDARLEPLTLALVERLIDRKLPYGGMLSGTVRGTGGNLGFGLTAQLTAEGVPEPFEVQLNGGVRLANGAFTLQRLTAELNEVPAQALRAIVPGFPLAANISGTVELRGPPERAPLTLNLRLALAGGTVHVSGMLDLTGAEPAYDFRGNLVGVNLARLFRPSVPPVALTASFTLRGRGTSAERLQAGATLRGGFSGWRAQPGDTVLIAANVQGGSIAVQSGTLLLGPVHLETTGQWRFVAPETGALRYHLAIRDMGPLAPYLPGVPNSATGSVVSEGTITGSLTRLRLAGDLAGTNVRVARWSIDSLRAEHALVFGDPLPEIHLEATARGITTPAAGAYSEATLNLQLASPALTFDLQADRVGGGIISVAGTGNVPYLGVRHIVLQRAQIDLAAERWALAAPAGIDWTAPGGTVDVHNVELRAERGEGRLRIDGRILPFAQIDARVETAALPLAAVQNLAGKAPLVTGLLSTTAIMCGPAETPTFDVKFRVDSGGYSGIAFHRAEGRIEYGGRTLTGYVITTVDSAGTAEVRASLPMVVALAPKVRFDLREEGAVTGSLKADNLNLKDIRNVFPHLQDVEGVLQANATLAGTIGAPILAGSIDVAGGAVTVLPFDRRYTDITADITFDQRSAKIVALRARSDGWLDATGQIDFPNIRRPTAAIAIALRKFRVAGVENHRAAAAEGDVRIAGPLSGPTISGKVTFSDGYLPVPNFGRPPLEEDLAFAETGPSIWRQMEPSSFLGNVRIDSLRLVAGSGLWVSMQNARAELTGQLVINKTDAHLRIRGMLRGDRGSYTLEAGPIIRRFDIIKAEIRFQGEAEINPALDITARRLVIDPSGRELDIEVRVTGTLQTPTLALASQRAADIPQSELLSFLIFGEPTLSTGAGNLPALGNVPGFSFFEETYLSGLAELASLELENALGASFDLFQIRVGAGDLGGLRSSSLVVGREVANNVFLTVESGIAALFGPNENVATSWAVRLEWRINSRTSLRAAYEPANRFRLIRGLGVELPVNRQQQLSVEARRRWSW